MHPRQKEIIWTSDLAYAVGLITTDGCLYANGRTFDFTSKDRDLVETFCNCLKIENRIGTKRNGHGTSTCWRVQFGNIVLYKFLLEVGLMPNKSKRLKELNIPNEFFFDFLRGHLDGDGSIKRYQDPIWPKSTRLYVVFISASSPHLVWIKEKIEELLGSSGFIQFHSGIYTLTFSKHNSIKLLNCLYPNDNVPCLKRTFDIAKDFLTMPRW
jgi:hypothetical protein